MTAEPPTASAVRVRLRFAKRGDLRLASHHDLMRCLERTIRRAGVAVAHSHGFNPRPKVVFALALGLGIEGRREVVDLELAEPWTPAEVLGRLAAASPPGLEFFEAEPAPSNRAPQASASCYAVAVPESRREAAIGAVAGFLEAAAWPHTRRRDDRPAVTLDLRPFVLGAGLDADGSLRFRLKVDPRGSARPEEVLDALGLRDLLEAGSVLVRTDIELATPAAAADAAARPPVADEETATEPEIAAESASETGI